MLIILAQEYPAPRPVLKNLIIAVLSGLFIALFLLYKRLNIFCYFQISPFRKKSLPIKKYYQGLTDIVNSVPPIIL